MVRKMTPSPEKVAQARDSISETARPKQKRERAPRTPNAKRQKQAFRVVGELPAITREKSGVVSEALAFLQGVPGRWTLIRAYEGESASTNAQGLAQRLREAGLEASARDGSAFARWVAK